MATYDSYAARAAELIASLQGGQENSENKIGEDYALFLLDIFAAVVKREYLSATRASRNTRLPSEFMQRYSPTFNTSEQEADPISNKQCKVIFEMPAPIVVDDLIDTVNYIGGTDGLSEFRRVRSQTELALLYRAHDFNRPSDTNLVAFTRSDNKVEIHGDPALEEVLIIAGFEMPSRVSGVNLDTDRYPISNSLMGRVKEIASKVTLDRLYGTPQDLIQDVQRQLDKLELRIIPK